MKHSPVLVEVDKKHHILPVGGEVMTICLFQEVRFPISVKSLFNNNKKSTSLYLKITDKSSG